MIPESDTAAVRRALREYYKSVERQDVKMIAEAAAVYHGMNRLYLMKTEASSIYGTSIRDRCLYPKILR